MAVTSTPIFPQVISAGFYQLVPADTTTLKTLFTAGANGSRIDNILVTSTDTGSKDLQFVITYSAVDYVVGTLSIPALSGFTAAVVPVLVFNHANFSSYLGVDANGNKMLFLPIGAVLKVKALSTVTVAKVISVNCQGGDF